VASIGIVLGAGGIVGQAFHGGVLRAVHEATGWDPRDAELVVGTSAGSVAGALLRAGVPADRIAGWKAPPEPGLSWEPGPRQGLPRSAAPDALFRALFRPFWRTRPGSLAAAAIPAGRVDPAVFTNALYPLYPDGWPGRSYWACAVRLHDSRRVVFGRDHQPTPHIADAVAASCAIPGYFTPVTIDGQRYVDGGVHSPTNADVVAGLGLDLVIVSSPMSVTGAPLRLPRIDMPARRLSRAYLGGEVKRIREAGTPVLTFQPTLDDLRVMGMNAMDDDRRDAVDEQAYRSARSRLESDEARDALAATSGQPIQPASESLRSMA
jgi:NTE family protein